MRQRRRAARRAGRLLKAWSSSALTIVAEDESVGRRRLRPRCARRNSPRSSSWWSCLAAFAIANPNFLSPLNISNMMAFLPELGIIALGMTLLLTAGEFDLSVGAVFALGPVVVMLLVQNGGVDIGVALLIGLLVCIAIGAINGLIVTKIGISSFLVTLSMLLVVRGAALYITQGFPLKSWDQPGFFVTLLAGSFEIGPFRLYTSLWWFIGAVAAVRSTCSTIPSSATGSAPSAPTATRRWRAACRRTPSRSGCSS